MELRIFLKEPNEPFIPTEGLVWHENGHPKYQAVLQVRHREGPRGEDWWGKWENVPVETEYSPVR